MKGWSLIYAYTNKIFTPLVCAKLENVQKLILKKNFWEGKKRWKCYFVLPFDLALLFIFLNSARDYFFVFLRNTTRDISSASLAQLPA
jgi:hypothetical protein